MQLLGSVKAKTGNTIQSHLFEVSYIHVMYYSQ